MLERERELLMTRISQLTQLGLSCSDLRQSDSPSSEAAAEEADENTHAHTQTHKYLQTGDFGEAALFEGSGVRVTKPYSSTYSLAHLPRSLSLSLSLSLSHTLT